MKCAPFQSPSMRKPMREFCGEKRNSEFLRVRRVVDTERCRNSCQCWSQRSYRAKPREIHEADRHNASVAEPDKRGRWIAVVAGIVGLPDVGLVAGWDFQSDCDRQPIAGTSLLARLHWWWTLSASGRAIACLGRWLHGGGALSRCRLRVAACTSAFEHFLLFFYGLLQLLDLRLLFGNPCL